MNNKGVTTAERLQLVDKLAEEIAAKLGENRIIVAKLRHGRIKWRVNERGQIKVDLEITL